MIPSCDIKNTSFMKYLRKCKHHLWMFDMINIFWKVKTILEIIWESSNLYNIQQEIQNKILVIPDTE